MSVASSVWRRGARALVVAMCVIAVAPPTASAEVGDAPSVFDILDVTDQAAQGQLHPCPEGPDTYTSGDCKYAQAGIVTRCTVLNTNTGRCFERQFQLFRYRGGTADNRSPSSTGSCKYAPPGLAGESDIERWQLVDFTVNQVGRGEIYRASSAHSAMQYNCDVERGPLFGRPVPFKITNDAAATFNFRHYCRVASSCGDFLTSIQFRISID